MKKIRICFLYLITLLFSANLFCDELQNYPSDEKTIFNNALIYYLNGDLQPAIHTLNRIKNGSDTEYIGNSYLLLGKIYKQTSENELALQSFAKAGSIDFSLKDGAIYEEALLLKNQNNIDKTLNKFNLLIEKFPYSPFSQKAFLELGEIYSNAGNYLAAEKAFDLALKKNPTGSNTDEILYKLGFVQEKLKKLSAAYKTYMKLIFQFPDSIYAEKAQNKKEDLTKVTNLQKYLPVPEDYLSAAKYLSGKNKYIASNEYLKQFISQFPGNPEYKEALIFYGINKYQYFDYGPALLAFNNFLNEFADHPLAAKAYFYKAKLLQKNNNNCDAAILYNKIINSFPKSELCDKALYNLAQISKTSGTNTESYTYLTKLYKNYPESPLASQAIWDCGWYFYTTGQLEAAVDAFQTADDLPEADELTAKNIYWAAKCAEKTGNIEKANKLYLSVYTKHFYSYFAYLVWENFSTDPDRRNLLLKNPWQLLTLSAIEPLITNETTRLQLLQNLGYIEELDYELSLLKQQNPGNDLLPKTLISRFNFTKGKYYDGVKNIEGLVSSELKKTKTIPKEMIQMAYPKLYWDIITKCSETNKLDPYLVLALIREESRFNPSARSKSNAQGLMQIIPRTALDISNRLKIPLPPESDMAKPEINIFMGTYYLAGLMTRFNNNLILSLAGYNGGPNNSAKWWAARGAADIDEFAETIPYPESKYYVQKVLKSYWMYKIIYYDASQEIAAIN